jgi:predicted glycoside hydrolase/deacetylase ChbG (UPF0249 family)
LPAENFVRPIVFIADDFGLSPAVDAGILALVAQGRLSGFGCLTQVPRWFEAAKAVPDRAGVHLGLHLNLTQGFAAHTWHRPLPVLIAQAYSGLLPPKKIRASLAEQLDRFLEAFGRAPDYVDGHQHVHQLPTVRDCLLDLLAERQIQPWLRCTAPLIAPKMGLKEWLIAHLGAPTLRTNAQRAGFSATPAFTGVYGFNQTSVGYLALLDSWLAQAPTDAVVMCHPGMAATVSDWDPIAPARAVELAVLQGDAFADLLRKHQRVISRFAVA